MTSEFLGNPISNHFSVAGAQVRLFEHGMTVDGTKGMVEVGFVFPKIGRTHIVTGTSVDIKLFDHDSIRFQPNKWNIEELSSVIHQALAQKLALAPLGHTGTRVPLALGPMRLVHEGNYGIPVKTMSELEERKLYDAVILGDDGQWHVAAPHVVYHRKSWNDFGMVHVTDIHVARRIDRFRNLLRSAGRTEAAQGMYNWNDRFRGFVRYANYLHETGVLDVVIATGDLYDYIFEDGDDPLGGGNAEFMHQLILGRAPGPEFPDVEELKVPIFMVPGNHDYRKYPYKLIFDIHVIKDHERVKNFPGYNLLQEEAQILGNLLDGRSGSEVPNVGEDGSARMVEFDPSPDACAKYLVNPGSYVVQLGAHRLFMLDSGSDTGIVDDISGAIRNYVGLTGEDERTFVGGSPNSEGITSTEFDWLSQELAETAPEALFIVGTHAPLFNMWNNEYPYFLRETQRASHPEHVHDFLLRHTPAPVMEPIKDKFDKMAELIHPHWFAGERDHQSVTKFVKRVNSQDLFDFGVLREYGEDVIQLLVGNESRRPVDLVLAGHTHRHNEFRVKREVTGELAFYMDFYTQNPTYYYPARFGSASDDITYVEVAAGASPDAAPWPMPHKAIYKNQLLVPPYADPLSASNNPRAWWSSHRPLVLQTGALGARDNSQVSFTGFRLITVKNNVIDKIHFIPTEKLERSNYRLPLDEAIRQEPERQYRYLERSRPRKAPAAQGAPVGIALPNGVTDVIYRDGDGRLLELWEQGATAGMTNLTRDGGNAVKAASDPSIYLDNVSGMQVVLYRGTDGQVHSLYWSTGAVGHDALGSAAHAPKAAGKPMGFMAKDGTHHVIYRAEKGHLHALYWAGQNAPAHEDLTAGSGTPGAAGDPSPYINTLTGENLIAYRGIDGNIHTLYWSTGAVGHDNLSTAAHAPKALGDPVAYYTSHNDTHQIVYRSADGHLRELWWNANKPVQHWDLTEATGAPPADSDASVYYSVGTNTKHVVYRTRDGHLHDIFWTPGGTTTHVDITLMALAPPAVDKPTAFTVEQGNTSHVVYRGKDNQIHEIRWTMGTKQESGTENTVTKGAPGFTFTTIRKTVGQQ